MTIPDAAINAVALWLEGIDPYGAEHGFSAVDETFWVQGVSLHNLLAAAMPAIREALAQRIRQHMRINPSMTADDALALVLGGTP